MSIDSNDRTLFQQMLDGTRPAQFILRSDVLGVAAIIDRSPADPEPDPARSNQVVAFPYEPGRGYVNRFMVAAALEAIARRLHQVYDNQGEDVVVVEHTEGRDVRNHYHVVQFVTRARGESARLHDAARLAEGRRLSLEQQAAFAAPITFDAVTTAAFEREVLEGLQYALEAAGNAGE